MIPFDLLFSVANVNQVSRFSKIGKINKLIKMVKVVRLLRLFKVKNKMVRHMADILKISIGTERLIYLLVTFFVL